MKMAVAALCVVVALSVMCVVDAADDVNPLEGLYQQQAQQMTLLQAKVTAMEAALSAMKQTVAFTAHYSSEPVDVGNNNQPLRFDAIVTNIGDGYNGHSGAFTAPVAGTYAFSHHVLHEVNRDHAYVHVIVETEGRELCRPVADNYISFQSGSCQIAVQIKAGQQVYARRARGGVYLQGGIYNSFSGFLISADIA